MHKHYIDYLRALATLGVITIHVTVHFYGMQEIFASPGWWLANGMNAASRFCVPVFVMISGALLLQSVNSPGEFYQKRLLRLLPPLLFWNLLYTVVEATRTGDWPGLLWFVKVGFWVAGEAAPHLWYLSMLLGLMSVTPFLALFVHGVRPGHREFLWLFVVLLGFGALDQLAALLAASRDLHLTWYQRFPGYIVYLLLGHYLDRHGVSLPISNPALALGVLVLLALGVTGNYWLASALEVSRDWWVLGNTMPMNILFAAAVFLLVRRSRANQPAPAWIQSLSNCSFGIYLIHPLFISLIVATVPGYDRHPLLAMPMTVALTLGLSWIAIGWLRRHAWFRSLS